MSAAMEKVLVACPQCGQQLQVPADAMGKQGRCPACKHVFLLSSLTAQPAFAAAANDPYEQAETDYALAPQREAAAAPAGTVNPAAPPTIPAATTQKYGHGFGWEHRGWDAGMTGGLAMMGIAVVWFFGGLAFDIIFYYPVILFIIGLVGFVRGLFTGNIAGKE